MVERLFFQQRRFGIHTAFAFEDEQFDFSIGGARTKQSVRVSYEALDLNQATSFSIANNQYLLRWTVPPVFLLAIFYIVIPVIPETWAIWLAAVLLCIGVAVFLAMAREMTAVDFTEIPTFGSDSGGVRGFVRIIRDRQHDRILECLSSRWRTRLRDLYAAPNLSGNLGEELAKLDRLLAAQIISEDEHRRSGEVLKHAQAARRSHTAVTKH